MNWKIVNEFPNYEINELGQVRNTKNNKILSQSLSSRGYYQINIGGKSRRTHRLLAIAFIENPNNLETINHIDGNKLNNSLDNLEWMSRSDNVIHSREELNKVPIPYSKSNKKHHLIGRTGNNSTRGIKVVAIFPDGHKEIFGSARQAGLKIFNSASKGVYIREILTKYPNRLCEGIKFENYEESN